MARASHTQHLKQKLTEALMSDHFIIHFGLRNPPQGKGLSSDGVRDRVVVLTYLHALESLYDTMMGSPWNRDPPEVDETGRTHVYVFGDKALTTFDKKSLIPEIYLPCRSTEPTTHAELLRATASAVHEGAHLLNFRARPYYDFNSEPWVWFDEGMAVLMETLVAAGNHDYCRFLVGWIDTPETSLDDGDAMYQAGMLVRYLAKRLGPDLVNRVWNESRPDEGPIDALQRLMPQPETFLSADPAVKDIFASGYCIDPYFIWDHESASLAPDIFFRFGERAISESVSLAPGGSHRIEGALDHLACRYYRFYLKGGVKRLWVWLSPEGDPDVTQLKAELAVITRERARRPAVALSRGGAGGGGGADAMNAESRALSVALDKLRPDEIDHLVLVVSNCGVKPSAKFHDHDDDKSYVINVTAD
ncbi:MAG: hypothetical protein H0T60_10835 [Acidobacteria bacterium]|nr:hypothetical protein [Acidobacteriota bacterium]